MVYIKGTIPNRVIKEQSTIQNGLKFMAIKVTIDEKTWLPVCIYRPPRVIVGVFHDFFWDKILIAYHACISEY